MHCHTGVSLPARTPVLLETDMLQDLSVWVSDTITKCNRTSGKERRVKEIIKLLPKLKVGALNLSLWSLKSGWGGGVEGMHVHM